MYEDAVLDVVSKTIPVFRRLKGGTEIATRPTGHFNCVACPTRPMSAKRSYITARVVNFEADAEGFQFIYSPHDAPYTEGRTPLQLKLAQAISNNWTYSHGEEWNEQIVFVRGYWVHGEFQHRHGTIRMGDHLENNQTEDQDDGGIFWPEMAINTWMPDSPGAYYDIPDVGNLVRMDKEQLHESMTIAKGSILAKMRTNSGWTPYNATTRKPKKKRTMNIEVGNVLRQDETGQPNRIITEGANNRARLHYDFTNPTDTQ